MEEIKASFKNGILNIEVPKKEKKQISDKFFKRNLFKLKIKHQFCCLFLYYVLTKIDKYNRI